MTESPPSYWNNGLTCLALVYKKALLLLISSSSIHAAPSRAFRADQRAGRLFFWGTPDGLTASHLRGLLSEQLDVLTASWVRRPAETGEGGRRTG